MNNNFWFNYDKKNNEDIEPLIEVVEEEKNEDIIPPKENKQKVGDKRKSAFIKLVIGVIFLLVLIILLNLGSKEVVPNNDDGDDNNRVIEEETIEDKLLKGNYKFEYVINITDLNNNLEKHTYKGSYLNDEIKGIFIDNNQEINYIFKNNEYYIMKNNEYILSLEEDIFPIIDYKYLDLNNIFNYIEGSTQNYKTEYSDGSVSIGYEILVKNLIINNTSEDKITITTTHGDEYVIEIDYTNLIKIQKENINACTIKLTYELVK